MTNLPPPQIAGQESEVDLEEGKADLDALPVISDTNSIITVTLDANGGTILYGDRFTVASDGKTATLSGENPLSDVALPSENAMDAPSGKYFLGWDVDPNTSIPTYTSDSSDTGLSSLTFDSDAVLYAVWGNLYTVTLHDNTQNNQTEVIIGAGSLITYYNYADWSEKGGTYYYEFSNPGYALIGWNTMPDGSGTAYDTTGIEVTEDIDLYAVWHIAYNVTFHSNTEEDETITLTGYGRLVIIQEGDYAFYATFSIPVSPDSSSRRFFSFLNPGYVFENWNTEADGTGSTLPEWEISFGIRITEDVDIYAQWEKAITITLHENNGITDKVITDTGRIGRPFELTANRLSFVYTQDLNFENSGYAITSWNTKADGTGETYDFFTWYNTGKEDLDLYAQWEPSYEVMIYLNNGFSDAVSLTGKGMLQISDNQYSATFGGYEYEFERSIYYSGHILAGFNTAVDGNGYFYPLDTAFPVKENLTLYAQWQEKQNKDNMEVWLNANGGIILPSAEEKWQVFESGKRAFVSLGEYLSVAYLPGKEDVTAPYEGLSLAGWAYDPNTAPDQVKFTSGLMLTMDYVLYAVWIQEDESYVITLESDEGCTLEVVLVEDGTGSGAQSGGTPVASGDTVPKGSVLQVTATAKAGYKLTVIPEATYTVTGDLTIKAASEKLTFTVTVAYDPTMAGAAPTATTEDGTAAVLDAVPYGTKLVLTAAAAKDGYEFLGWYQSGGKQLSAGETWSFTVFGAQTVEARYQKAAGIVTFMANNRMIKTVSASAITAEDFPEDPSPMSDFEFEGWDKTVEEINAALAAGENVTVTAKFKAAAVSFTVSIYNGESEIPETVEMTESVWLTYTAEDVAGKNFAYWTMDGEIISYNKKTSFRVYKTCTVEAVYTVEAVDAVGTAIIKTANYNANTRKFSFVAYLTVPDGAVIEAAGLYAAADTSAKYTNKDVPLTAETADFVKSSTLAIGKSAPVTYTWNKTAVAIGDIWYVRPYVIYTLNGVSETVYGTQICAAAGQDFDSSEKGTAIMKSASYNATNQKATFVAYLVVPEGGTIISAGLVAAQGKTDSNADGFDPTTTILTAENADYVKASTLAVGKGVPVTYTWNKTKVMQGDVWYARAYLVYTDATGTEHIVYGQLSQVEGKAAAVTGRKVRK